MRVPEITLKGKTFKLANGMEVFLELGNLWGLETLEEVNEQFQVLEKIGKGTTGTPLKVFKTISEVLSVMIAVHEENTEKLSPAEIRSCTMEEFQYLAVEIANCVVASMPHGDPSDLEEGKKKTPKLKKQNL